MGVVVVDPPAQAFPKLRAGLKGLKIDALVFQAAPEALDEDAVHPAALAVYADPDLGVQQHAGEARGGELGVLVDVEDLGCSVAGQGVFQGFDAKNRRAACSIHARTGLSASPSP